MSLREKYIDGHLYKIGDIVLDKNERTIHEIVSLGTNYLTVVNENGNITKMWLTDAVLANALKEDFDDLRRKRSSSSQIAYVGYKSKNFNKEIYEAFKQSLTEKDAKKDKFVMLNLIRQTDSLLESVNNINRENYLKIKSLFEQTQKYIDKLNISCYHSYRTELNDKLNEFEIIEGYQMTGTDKDRAVKIFSDALKIETSHLPSHEERVNAIAYHVKAGRWSPESWKLMGSMFNKMTEIGIKWNKDIFAKPTQKAMGIKN